MQWRNIGYGIKEFYAVIKCAIRHLVMASEKSADEHCIYGKANNTQRRAKRTI